MGGTRKPIPPTQGTSALCQTRAFSSSRPASPFVSADGKLRLVNVKGFSDRAVRTKSPSHVYTCLNPDCPPSRTSAYLFTLPEAINLFGRHVLKKVALYYHTSRQELRLRMGGFFSLMVFQKQSCLFSRCHEGSATSSLARRPWSPTFDTGVQRDYDYYYWLGGFQSSSTCSNTSKTRVATVIAQSIHTLPWTHVKARHACLVGFCRFAPPRDHQSPRMNIKFAAALARSRAWVRLDQSKLVKEIH